MQICWDVLWHPVPWRIVSWDLFGSTCLEVASCFLFFFVQMGCSYVFGEDNVEVLTSQEEILDLNMNMLRFNGSFQMFSDGFGLS